MFSFLVEFGFKKAVTLQWVAGDWISFNSSERMLYCKMVLQGSGKKRVSSTFLLYQDQVQEEVFIIDTLLNRSRILFLSGVNMQCMLSLLCIRFYNLMTEQ